VRHIWHDIKLLAAADARHVEGDPAEHSIQVMNGDHFVRQFDDGRTPPLGLCSRVRGYALDFQHIPVRTFARVGDDLGGTRWLQHEGCIDLARNLAQEGRAAQGAYLLVIIDKNGQFLVLFKARFYEST